ncbi:MAG TPA: hypothetical protein VE981_12040 [Planctomycetota bacterium]|nr:hypothetical protein [Planctomycetota bacterium]
MWKDSTGRKVLPPKSAGPLLLYSSVIPLSIALIAAFFGFRDGSTAVNGAARVISGLAAAFFVLLAGMGIRATRRSD